MSELPLPHLSTTVPVEKCPFQLEYHHQIFHLGSCFSESIGARLASDQFQVLPSPFGIVYDPAAMADQLDRLLSDQNYSFDDLIHDGQLFHSLDHHSFYSGVDADDVLHRINQTLANCRQTLPACEYMILTFANTRSFVHRPTGRRAANCHQLPATVWAQEELGLQSMTDRFTSLITRLQARFPSLRIVVTISPVRYIHNGMQHQSRSKAKLHLLAEALEAHHTWTFPSFELLIDELRDYRFYDRDLLHPSELAIDLIYHRWLEATLTPSAKKLLPRIRAIRRDLNHRLRFPETDQALAFRRSIVEKIQMLRTEYPELPWLFSDVRQSVEPK